ncbi:lipid droplet-regulating VLDL assembly factor AUP1 isoform X1 [Chiloscyllium plagiosum]|uniref:lipid droplet-regulating VLDL assembly factor AUP1 isoform X1 n=2 Tax=Chiloscyllium plagiosum TaxID=36176 RepID=UPI001CB84944|nr:lipid droplet-regulating VLDL assembly factor AUP1 isoform X1 [Chiloscyllium plagiosum]
MERPKVQQLLEFKRLPTDGFILALLVLYTPFGICLMFLRIFIGLHVFLVSSVLPDGLLRRVIVRAMCTILGVIVLQRGSRHRNKNIKIYISNHITQFDHNILNFLTACYTPLLEGHSGFVSWARGYLELGWLDNRTRLAEALRHYSSLDGARGLLLFPEDETTNGKVGLLKFSSWPFTIDSTVQPLVLTVKRPFVSVNVVESSWVTELLWMFFIPFTVYQVRWLPSMSQMDEESVEDFAVRVQEHLATELGVVSTQHTKSDKVEYLKRMKHTAPQAASSAANSHPSGARARTFLPGLSISSLSAEDVRITGMAKQVKEVLPHIPLSVIKMDLVNTKCVDTTITNLLEGRVQFTPEEVSVSPSSISLSNKPQLASCKLVTSLKKAPKDASTAKPVAKTRFEKSPVDRHLSLQERKEALYAYARRQYIEKHGLQLDTEESQAEEP